MRWKPDVVIYHDPCDDGFAAAWAAFRRYGDEVLYVPSNYGAPPPDVTGKHILIVDFSYKRGALRTMAQSAASIVILDHHITAQEELAPFAVDACGRAFLSADDVAGMLEDLAELGAPPVLAYFDQERSGARLAWRFCHGETETPDLIRYVEDRDLWRFHIPGTRAISLWIRTHPYDFDVWTSIAAQLADEKLGGEIMQQASAIETYYDQRIADMAMQAYWSDVGGFKVPTVNCPRVFASDVAHALLRQFPNAHFAATWNERDGHRGFSLRSEDSRVDVAAIAATFGGGGHRNAAGFAIKVPA